jgi:non-canonical poly(A) RNA polymerase PAPD5/7
VSVGSGGIVPKMSLSYAMESARQAAVSMGSYDGAVSWNERLFVDCPLTGGCG